MKFFEDVGSVALGSRVRNLAETLSLDAADVYAAYGNSLEPRWFPIFITLKSHGRSSISSIATYIGHSHASVSKIVKQMISAGLVETVSNETDRRATNVVLSAKGKKLGGRMEEQLRDVRDVIEEISQSSTHNLWAAIGEWEFLLQKKSFRDRVLSKRKDRSAMEVKIESYKPKYKTAFQSLNEEWLKKYFEVEETDRKALNDPKRSILDSGGFIFVATVDGEPLGVCALIRRQDLGCFELAKMAVSPKAQGKGVGQRLMQAAVDKALSLGESKIFLESNTKLEPAIRLYEKFGFKKIVGMPSPYARSNIQMELQLI